MSWFDLTHTLEPGMPVFPGDPAYGQTPLFTMEQDRFRETWLSLNSHTGTHMDAPAHLLPQGETLDTMPLERFVGRAYVLDCTGWQAGIPPACLEDLPGAVEFLLLSTGWETRWGSADYIREFPTLTKTGAELLVQRGLKGVGIDTMSVDAVGSDNLPIHRTLLNGGLVLVENLKGLLPLRGQSLWFGAFPLAFTQSDGAPVRAVAWDQCETFSLV